MNRTNPALVLLLLAVALPACRQSEETVATTGATLPVTAAAPTTAAPVTGTVEPTPTLVTPPPPVTATGPGAARDAGVVFDAGALLDAGARDAGGTTDAGAARTDAGSASQRAQACFDKCAVSMQNCIIPAPADGGFPKFKDPAECRAAADACRAACQP